MMFYFFWSDFIDVRQAEGVPFVAIGQTDGRRSFRGDSLDKRNVGDGKQKASLRSDG